LYRLWEAIRPEALREPARAADPAELARVPAVQLRLMRGGYRPMGGVDLFEITRELHETIVAWSGNRFYLDALRRSNDLRRLIEYSKVMETQKIDAFAAEHIEILDTISASDFATAEQLVLQHLQRARETKT